MQAYYSWGEKRLRLCKNSKAQHYECNYEKKKLNTINAKQVLHLQSHYLILLSVSLTKEDYVPEGISP